MSTTETLHQQIVHDLNQLAVLTAAQEEFGAAQNYIQYLMGELEQLCFEVRTNFCYKDVSRRGETREEDTVNSGPIENLQEQLMKDMERFGGLMNRYSLGEASVKQERDQLEGALEIKLAILEGLKRLQEQEDFEGDIL
ncbi:MAG: hypothetical protein O7G87_19490 [bacterium]|nr:hypothetical protein [bacterium]